MNYEDRDAYGIYKPARNNGAGPDAHTGPGPHLMGADTLIGNESPHLDEWVARGW